MYFSIDETFQSRQHHRLHRKRQLEMSNEAAERRLLSYEVMLFIVKNMT